MNKISRLIDIFYKKALNNDRLFIRFGKFGARSKVMLDKEFINDALSGKQFEAGVSVLFAEPYKNGYKLIPPNRSRAQYALPYDYFAHMLINNWMGALVRDDIFLLRGDLIMIPATKFDDATGLYEDSDFETWDVGSDGEPVIENITVVSKLKPDNIYLPDGISIKDKFEDKINDHYYDIIEDTSDLILNKQIKEMFYEINPDILYNLEDKVGKKKTKSIIIAINDLSNQINSTEDIEKYLLSF